MFAFFFLLLPFCCFFYLFWSWVSFSFLFLFLFLSVSLSLLLDVSFWLHSEDFFIVCYFAFISFPFLQLHVSAMVLEPHLAKNLLPKCSPLSVSILSRSIYRLSFTLSYSLFLPFLSPFDSLPSGHFFHHQISLHKRHNFFLFLYSHFSFSFYYLIFLFLLFPFLT